MSLASTPQAISRTSCIGSPVLPAAGSSVASVGRAGGPDLRARVGSELGVDGRRSCFLNVLKLRSGKHRQPSAGAHLMSQHASGRRRGGGVLFRSSRRARLARPRRRLCRCRPRARLAVRCVRHRSARRSAAPDLRPPGVDDGRIREEEGLLAGPFKRRVGLVGRSARFRRLDRRLVLAVIERGGQGRCGQGSLLLGSKGERPLERDRGRDHVCRPGRGRTIVGQLAPPKAASRRRPEGSAPSRNISS
jgi:hypothetical protein